MELELAEMGAAAAAVAPLRRLASAALCCLSVYPANIFFKCSVCISERPKRKITAHGRATQLGELSLCLSSPCLSLFHSGHSTLASTTTWANNGAQIYGSPTRLEAVKMANLSFGSRRRESLDTRAMYMCGLFEFVPAAPAPNSYSQLLLPAPGCC